MINLCMEGCSQAGWFSCLDVNPILAETHSYAVKAVPLKQGLQWYSFISQKSRVLKVFTLQFRSLKYLRTSIQLLDNA